MGKKRYEDASVKESKDVAVEDKKQKNSENNQIVQFVKPGKNRRKLESEISSNFEPHEGEESLSEKNFVKKGKRKKSEGEASCLTETYEKEHLVTSEKTTRFNIDGEIVKPKSHADGTEKCDFKRKVKKPRWTAERKVEERKRKANEPPKKPEDVKTNIKKQKKHRKKKEQYNQQSTNSLATLAIQYLQNWKYDPFSWKFSKVKQTWLLKNMFDLRKVPSSVFPVLVEYIGGSKGGSRQKTYKEASKIIQKLEEKLSTGEAEEDEIQKCLTEDSEEDKEEIHQRARSIMQALSDCI